MLECRPVRTPADEVRACEIRKLKLAGKDKIHAILDEHRRNERRRRERRGPPDLTA